MAPKSEAEIIQFLIALIESSETRPNWNQVAIDTELYKAGKFVKQAYDGHKKKYGAANAASGVKPASPAKSVKKKRSIDNNEGDTPTKKAKSKPIPVDSDDEIAA